ncbi:hypothetical protein CFP56_041497 [Quercus suber]|uniref:Uncharacterized protein n=1 Tax=Quercus suber TaxID=58331 RepID=A0AAW0LL12_QUESU
MPLLHKSFFSYLLHRLGSDDDLKFLVATDIASAGLRFSDYVLCFLGFRSEFVEVCALHRSVHQLGLEKTWIAADLPPIITTSIETTDLKDSKQRFYLSALVADLFLSEIQSTTVKKPIKKDNQKQHQRQQLQQETIVKIREKVKYFGENCNHMFIFILVGLALLMRGIRNEVNELLDKETKDVVLKITCTMGYSWGQILNTFIVEPPKVWKFQNQDNIDNRILVKEYKEYYAIPTAVGKLKVLHVDGQGIAKTIRTSVCSRAKGIHCEKFDYQEIVGY